MVKGNTYEEFYGTEKALIIRNKLKENISAALNSRSFLEVQEWKQNLSDALKGKKKTKEHCQHICESTKGIKRKDAFTEVHKQRLSAAKQEIPFERWEGFVSVNLYDKNWNCRFKRAIRKRDNYICLKCNIHQEKLSRTLNIHHINYDKKLTIPQNCCSLCNGCNSEVNKNRKHWTKFFQSLLAERYGYQYNEAGEVEFELNLNQFIWEHDK